MSENAINKLKEKINNNLNDYVFVSHEIEHYKYFCEKTELNIEYYNPKNFEEVVMIINSCKFGFFGFSSMAVIANALHKEHYFIGILNGDYILNNLKNQIPYVLDNLV